MKNPTRIINSIPPLSTAVRCFSIHSNTQASSANRITDMIGKNLLTLQSFTPVQIENLLWSARDMKLAAQADQTGKMSKLLRGKSFAAIFQKKSTRTRLSFEAGAHQLGAHAIFCNKDDIHLGVNENVKDTSLVISRLVNAIVARVYEHKLLEELASFASVNGVPVINALSDKHHPLQALADLMTIYEKFGRLSGLKIAWVGDGNNVLHSLLIASVKMKMHVSAACPNRYEMNGEILEYARKIASSNNTQVVTTQRPEEAVSDADVIVTDTWISMGQESEKQERLKAFEGYQVNLRMLMNAKPDWMFLHCLPRKTEEVNDEVFYHKQSYVFEEAENRKWTTMAVLANLLQGYATVMIRQKPKF